MVLEQTFHKIKSYFAKTQKTKENTDTAIYQNLSQDHNLVQELTPNEKKVVASFSTLDIFDDDQLQLLQEWFSSKRKIDRTTSMSRLNNIRKQLEDIKEKNGFYLSELKAIEYPRQIVNYTNRIEHLEEELIRSQRTYTWEKENLEGQVNIIGRVKEKDKFKKMCKKIEDIKRNLDTLGELTPQINSIDKQMKNISKLRNMFGDIIQSEWGRNLTQKQEEKNDLKRSIKKFTLGNYDLYPGEDNTCSAKELHKKISTYHRTNKRRSLSEKHGYTFWDEKSVTDAVNRKILEKPLTASTDQEYMNIGMKGGPTIHMETCERNDFHEDAVFVKCCGFSEFITGIYGGTTPLGISRTGVSYISGKSINGFRGGRDSSQLDLDDISYDRTKSRKPGMRGVAYGDKDISSTAYINKDPAYKDILGAVSSATLFNQKGGASEKDIIALANTMKNKYGNIYFSMPVLNKYKKLDTVLYHQDSIADKNEVKYVGTDIHEGSKVYISYGEIIDEHGLLSESSVCRGFKNKSDFTHFLKMLSSKNIEFGGFLVREKKGTYKHTIMSYDQLMKQEVICDNGYSLLLDYMKTSDVSLTISDFDNGEAKKAGSQNRKFIDKIKKKLRDRGNTYIKKEQKFIRERNKIQ